MPRKIKLVISGKGAETDAPAVEDVLDQLRDYHDILKEVEEAVAEDGKRAIDWRIVNASRNSPLSFEFEAFPHEFAVNIDRRAESVVSATAVGRMRCKLEVNALPTSMTKHWRRFRRCLLRHR